MSTVAIIGAGIGGIATANILAAMGHQVTVYEQHAMAGGRAGQLHIDGFTFDTGPSWYLMPEVFDHYYQLLGESRADHIPLTRLDPAYKAFFPSHNPITVHTDIRKDAASFEAIETGAGTRLKTYLERAGTLYDAALKHFLYTNFDAPGELLSPKILGQAPQLLKAAATPIHRAISKQFQDQRLQQILEYPMVFLGSSPFDAPAIYSLMSHMDFTQGVLYPQGGIYTIIKSLESIGIKRGVTFRYNCNVSGITTAAERATGLTLAGGSTVHADIIISNADLHFTETQLLPTAARSYDTAYWKRKQAGPSALLMYLGIKGKLPELEHHNLLFTAAWKANFDAIYHTKKWPHPASIYICNPSKTDSSVAPEGYENLFVLVPAPAGLETSEDALQEHARQYLDEIAQTIGVPDLTKRIVTQHIVGPQYFSDVFNSWQGTALGLSHRLDQSALFRPANKSKKLANLYYVGGNTMPGIGLPMCLIGAELIAKRFIGDRSTGPLAKLPKKGEANA